MPGGAGQYDYAARYTAGQTEFYAPARLPDAAADAAAKAAIRPTRPSGLRDISRTDMIVSDTGEVYFLEVNVSPGMTETSTLPMALDAAGHRFGTACLTLLDLAASRGPLTGRVRLAFAVLHWLHWRLSGPACTGSGRSPIG